MTRMRFAVSLFALSACAAPPSDPVNAGTDADPVTDPTDGSDGASDADGSDEDLRPTDVASDSDSDSDASATDSDAAETDSDAAETDPDSDGSDAEASDTDSDVVSHSESGDADGEPSHTDDSDPPDPTDPGGSDPPLTDPDTDAIHDTGSGDTGSGTSDWPDTDLGCSQWISLEVREWNEENLCWSSYVDREFCADYWWRWSTDANRPCNDITFVVAMVDGSCFRLPRDCGGSGGPPSGDPSVDYGYAVGACVDNDYADAATCDDTGVR